MLEVSGNYFEYATANNVEVLVFSISQSLNKDGELVMNTGLMSDFNDRFEGLAKEFGDLTVFKKSGILVSWREVVVIGLPTKYDWRKKADKNLVRKGIKQLEEFVDFYGCKSILLPRPGCGQGQLKWPEVKKMMKHLDDRYIVIKKDWE